MLSFVFVFVVVSVFVYRFSYILGFLGVGLLEGWRGGKEVREGMNRWICLEWELRLGWVGHVFFFFVRIRGREMGGWWGS